MSNGSLACTFCNLDLDKVFIKCGECKNSVFICLYCFSCGLQNDVHRNSHWYHVVNTARVGSFANWSINEELNLVNALQNNRHTFHLDSLMETIGNNKKMADSLGLKSWLEIKDHVEDWSEMINEKDSDEHVDWNFENFVSEKNALKLISGDSSFNLRENEYNPPRPAIHSIQYKRMSGFRPSRADFETEYKNNMEMELINDMDFDEPDSDSNDDNEDETVNVSDTESDIETFDVDNELKCEILKAYRDLVIKRYSIKHFIKKFGLINEIAVNLLNNNYNNLINENSAIRAQNIFYLPLKFYRYFRSYNDLVKYLETAEYALSIKKRINELNSYRENGLRLFKQVKVYKSLKLRRDNHSKSSHLSSLLTCLRFDVKSERNDLMNANNSREWLKKFLSQEKKLPNSSLIPAATNGSCELGGSPKALLTEKSAMEKKVNLLKIENYPEFDKLNEDEKDFCRLARIQPIVYLRVKHTLIAECAKAGFVTYSRARKIAGIDVNKTRKIHNLMLNLGMINEQPKTL